MKMSRYSTLAFAAAFATILHAQSNPLSAEVKRAFGGIKNNLLKSAEKMPEENYSFKPAPTVRSFGQLIGHVADYHYIFCGAANGESKNSDLENTKKSKADLIAALKESIAYCDAIYDAQTDAKAAEMIKLGNGTRSRLSRLYTVVSHDNEHYGNIVTYMRMKDLVPPSSEGQ
jgi:uncharacterized damage-inducible protein DinB